MLHIYAQPGEHDDVFIVGTDAELKKLIQTIQQAIEKDFHNENGFWTQDGEGYGIMVIKVPEKKPESVFADREYVLPYTDKWSKDNRDTVTTEWDLFREHKDKHRTDCRCIYCTSQITNEGE